MVVEEAVAVVVEVGGVAGDEVPAVVESSQRYVTMSPVSSPPSSGREVRWQVPPQSTHTIVSGSELLVSSASCMPAVSRTAPADPV